MPSDSVEPLEDEADFDFERELLRSFERRQEGAEGRQAEESSGSGRTSHGRSARGRQASGQGKAAGREKVAEPFNSPFRNLADSLSFELSSKDPPAAVPSPRKAASRDQGKAPAQAGSTQRDASSPAEADEEALFWRAMQGVEPLADKNEVAVRRAPSPSKVVSEEAEALARLSDLVTGNVAFDVSDTVEYVEGIAKGLDRRLLVRLRKGHYSVQAHLDLHGMTREEAKDAVFDFLVDARRKSLRCLLVITGRGRHSEGKEPVLKTALTEWLTGKKLGRHVLAFCSARPHDGGAGAFYVLLRR